VNERAISVFGHPDLTTAVRGARTSPKGDGGWSWSRKDASVDLSPLVAVTLAWWAAAQVPEVGPGESFAFVL
jgi:hypothetical protein